MYIVSFTLGALINQTEATKMNLFETATYKSLNNIAKAFNNDYGFVPFEALHKAARALCESEGLSEEQRQDITFEITKHYNCQVEIF